MQRESIAMGSSVNDSKQRDSYEQIKASIKSVRTVNPIRQIVDNLKPPVNHPKSFLNLALGDPTKHGNLNCPKMLVNAMHENMIDSATNCDGYVPSFGSIEARRAIAVYNMTSNNDIHAAASSSSIRRFNHHINDDDVVIASGCSGALDLALTALLNEGDNVLCPRPGFPLYQVIAESLGATVKHYNLDPTSNWQCDLDHMESLVDSRTRAILVNNPSNPCGSVYSAEHLADVLSVARKHALPVIADEIYGGCVFEGSFSPMHTLCDDVPVLQVGGLAKEFIVPGWRFGWIIVHDRRGSSNYNDDSAANNGNCKGDARAMNSPVLGDVRKGLRSLTQLVLGANSLVMSVIPRLLTPTPGGDDDCCIQEFKEHYLATLRDNIAASKSRVDSSDVLTMVVPQGALYAMIQIDFTKLHGVNDDNEFACMLLSEENLSLLPGQCFGMSGYVRLVTCPPKEMLEEAIDRLLAFCARHAKAA